MHIYEDTKAHYNIGNSEAVHGRCNENVVCSLTAYVGTGRVSALIHVKQHIKLYFNNDVRNMAFEPGTMHMN